MLFIFKNSTKLNPFMPISETFANSVVPDQMPQNGFRSGSTLFALSTEISIQDNELQ